MVMTTTSVAELKQNLSRYLRLVETGGEVLVTSHRRPVARLVPSGPAAVQVRAPTQPRVSIASLDKGAPLTRRDVVEALVKERRRR